MTKNLKFNDSSPIYIQITEDIILDIIKGDIALHSKMLSVRELALLYKVNPNTVQNVVRELEDLGIIEIKKNVGMFVKSDLDVSILKEKEYKKVIEKSIADAKRLNLSLDEVIKMMEDLWH